MKIMMSAAGSPASVSIIQHLRALGHRSVGINASRDAGPLARKFCDEFHVAPLGTDPEFLRFLTQRLREVDLFMPFVDEELVAIARGWDEIAPELRARIALSEPQVVLDCVDKLRFQQVCEESGLPIAPRADDAPAFFKPRFGRGGKGVVACVDQRIHAAYAGRDGVMQRAIEGQEFTVDAIYSRSGQLLATSPRRRLAAAGVSTLGEVVPDEALHALAEALGRRWRFRYAINFQVIRDAHGHDFLIELNPRLAGSAIFSALAGCDPFAATIALHEGLAWEGRARPLRIARYWTEFVEVPA
ncbi:MAG: ATP-grasp domain-containing protein [Pseudomonadota bacterium]